MPFYTATTPKGTVSLEITAKISEEITRIHTTVMKMPKNFVRVVFHSRPNGFGFTSGEQVPMVSLNRVLRSGHADGPTAITLPIERDLRPLIVK
jgi:phenylpyruvate tautomerase PptA (4-oxalocrotonate tautomerase family)